MARLGGGKDGGVMSYYFKEVAGRLQKELLIKDKRLENITALCEDSKGQFIHKSDIIKALEEPYELLPRV